MNFSFLNSLREINNEDDRIVTITLLIDIISNLIHDRNNSRHTSLPSSYIQEIFGKYKGAIKCLETVGFKQVNDDYIFDRTTTDEQLKQTVKVLENELEFSPADRYEKMKRICEDLGIVYNENNDQRSQNKIILLENLRLPVSLTKVIPFIPNLKLAESHEDKRLHHVILSSIIPLEDFHRKILKQNVSNGISRRELLLIGLLKWFKEDFFTWFDRATCTNCKIPMDFVEYVQPTIEQREQGDASRVELYRCKDCSSEYRFPRYNAPSKLLETRSGRCGEAANLFAFLCRALSFKTRYIYDPTDHVWTEVYSDSEHRWIHCDACENLCDSPLVYEKGWKKDLSFCIAFAIDHVQDVTWRYVTNYKQTLLRRNINEKMLSKTISKINKLLQTELNAEERKKLLANQIEDIVSMLKEEKSTKEAELHGRQSGSLAWKLSRGEIDQQDDITNGFIFLINNDECERGSISIEYDSVNDKYFRNGIEEEKREGWSDRVFSASNIQRKVERDWKMVYLSRKQLNSDGILSWAIKLPPEQEKLYRFHRIDIQFPSTTFDQYAKVQCQLQIDDSQQIINIPSDNSSSFHYVIDDKTNSSSNIRICLHATLKSSNDENDSNAWQKAQLFRQSTEQTSSNNQSHFLKINATFIRRNSNS